MTRDFSSKTQLRTDDIIDRRERHPAFGFGFVFATETVPEANVFLGSLEAREGWETLNVPHLGIRPDHVRLAGEDEDPHGRFVRGSSR